MFFKKHFLSLILFVLVTLVSGCTKENTDDCFSGLRLKFSFTLHNNGGSLFGGEVNRIRVYLFDEQGVLQLYALDDSKTIEYSYMQNGQLRTVTKANLVGALPEDYMMQLDVAPGKYKVVAWGGSAKETESTFFHAHMNNPMTHDYSEGVIIGQTRMEDFRMFIKYNLAPDLPEDIVPTVAEIDDLWYGTCGTRNEITSKYTMKEVIVKNGAVTEEKIDLIKNTNVLKVTITGYENILAASQRASTSLPLNVWVTAANGRYKIDNSIGEWARSIRYVPHSEQLEANKLMVDIKLLRMDVEKHTAQPMYLTIEDPVTLKKFPGKPIDIVNTLMQAKDARGNYIYNNQADFDREYEHPIEIKIDMELNVTVFVNGWEITQVIPEV